MEEVKRLHAAGRPILIGTRSIDKSERLSDLLKQAKIDHRVLNARHIAAEAEIVAEAGQPGKVTVATNMAGRGTDIKLGEGVTETGGWAADCRPPTAASIATGHDLATARHEEDSQAQQATQVSARAGETHRTGGGQSSFAGRSRRPNRGPDAPGSAGHT